VTDLVVSHRRASMSKAGRTTHVGLPRANTFHPHKPGSKLRSIQNFVLCLALPLSISSAQSPQPTSQSSGGPEQQIQPAQLNQTPGGPNGLGNAASGLVMNPTKDTMPPQLRIEGVVYLTPRLSTHRCMSRAAYTAWSADALSPLFSTRRASGPAVSIECTIGRTATVVCHLSAHR